MLSTAGISWPALCVPSRVGIMRAEDGLAPGFIGMIAKRTGTPIIPCSIVGAEEIYPILGDVKPLARLLGLPFPAILALFVGLLDPTSYPPPHHSVLLTTHSLSGCRHPPPLNSKLTIPNSATRNSTHYRARSTSRMQLACPTCCPCSPYLPPFRARGRYSERWLVGDPILS